MHGPDRRGPAHAGWDGAVVLVTSKLRSWNADIDLEMAEPQGLYGFRVATRPRMQEALKAEGLAELGLRGKMLLA